MTYDDLAATFRPYQTRVERLRGASLDRSDLALGILAAAVQLGELRADHRDGQFHLALLISDHVTTGGVCFCGWGTSLEAALFMLCTVLSKGSPNP
jgi:hypothetical protein